MGEAIAAGLVASGEGAAASLSADSFVIADPSDARREELARAHGFACVADAREIDAADLVVIAVKPQVAIGILEGIAAEAPFAAAPSDPLFVSIAAGVETSSIETALGEGARVVRVMPNMPLVVGEGATAVCGGAHASAADVELVVGLFSALGFACEAAERDMDAVCAVSGSGPAYVAAMIEALAAAGERQGLSAELARGLALQTVYGTAKVLAETGCDVAEFRESVCSPGGTTIAALDAMAARGFGEAIDAGVAAAVRRSKELASS